MATTKPAPGRQPFGCKHDEGFVLEYNQPLACATCGDPVEIISTADLLLLSEGIDAVMEAYEERLEFLESMLQGFGGAIRELTT